MPERLPSRLLLLGILLIPSVAIIAAVRGDSQMTDPTQSSVSARSPLRLQWPARRDAGGGLDQEVGNVAEQRIRARRAVAPCGTSALRTCANGPSRGPAAA